MCEEAVKQIREEGIKVYQSLKRELYLNHAGLKNKTNITEILKSYRELLEPEIFLSIRDYTGTNDGDENGRELLLSFQADTMLLGKSPQIEDGILEIEASSIISSGKPEIPFRKYRSALLKKTKKHETEEILENSAPILSKLNQLCLRQYAYKQKDSHDLGFLSYLDLYESLECHRSTELAELAKQFIRDTDYISRDLLGWFLQKRMDIKLKDASTNDISYLLSSFELKDSFPKLNPKSLAQNLLDDTELLLPAVIRFDTEKRQAHVTGSFLYASNPGVEMLISTNFEQNIFDYESFLESFGEGICYGFTQRDDYFEFTHLRNKTFVKLFSTLFKNLIFEPAWLKKHFRLEAEDDLLKFMHLRRLIQIRILCAKLIFEIALYQKQDDKAEMYREIMETASHCKSSVNYYMYDIQPHLSSLDLFKAILAHTRLNEILKANYDEEWWREKEAGEFLSKIWETGGRTSLHTLSNNYGFGELNIKKLLQNLEQVLG